LWKQKEQELDDQPSAVESPAFAGMTVM